MKKIVSALILVFVMGIGMVVLFLKDPTSSRFFPQCIFRMLTGWSCPACGIQRAIHSALNGRWSEALAYNYFLVISLPYAGAIVVAWLLKKTGHGGRLTDEIEHPRYVWIFVVLFFVWWIIRNIYNL